MPAIKVSTIVTEYKPLQPVDPKNKGMSVGQMIDEEIHRAITEHRVLLHCGLVLEDESEWHQTIVPSYMAADKKR